MKYVQADAEAEKSRCGIESPGNGTVEKKNQEKKLRD